MNFYYKTIHNKNYNKYHVFESNLFNYDLTINEIARYIGRIYDPTNTKYDPQYIHAEDLSSTKFCIMNINNNSDFDDYNDDHITLLLDEHNIIIKAFKG